MRKIALASLVVACALSLPATEQPAAAEEYLVGPSGGPSGVTFSDRGLLAASASDVREVRIWAGDVVDSIQMVHETPEGFHELRRHGGSGGTLYTFELRQGEYITALSGKHGCKVISQILIETSLNRSSPPYGPGDGQRGCPVKNAVATFRYEAPPGLEIAGFLGRAGQFLDALGVVLRTR